jgi:hypothetical protein
MLRDAAMKLRPCFWKLCRLAKSTSVVPNIHRLSGIDAFLRTVTHARLHRPLGSASNSARPTVTVRPSGNGTAPPRASTAATRSLSAARHVSTSDAMSRMSELPLSTRIRYKKIATAQSQKYVAKQINSTERLARTGAYRLLTRPNVVGHF